MMLLGMSYLHVNEHHVPQLLRATWQWHFYVILSSSSLFIYHSNVFLKLPHYIFHVKKYMSAFVYCI